MKSAPKVPALLTVDLEDYRRQTLRDDIGGSPGANPGEVERQLDILLETFASIGATATFFSVGRLTRELPTSTWARIVEKHELGCHGDEHERVWEQGRERFRDDLRRAKSSLEQVSGVQVTAFRAPYFSSDGCDPWFGEELAQAGFRFDSSRRVGRLPPGSSGTFDLEGSNGVVREVPMPSVGFGLKRLTVIGGTYFRLLPLQACKALLRRAHADGFVPMVYLHPYDIDPSAPAIDYPRGTRYWKARAGDNLRRTGRDTAIRKLRALAADYAFRPLSSLA
jgi:peptidoglycan/xylan/chitin deacetylase (PgdA/CDA1 family)